MVPCANSIAIALLAALVGGCAALPCCPTDTCDSGACDTMAFDCRPIERLPLVVDVAQVPASSVPAPANAKWCALTENEAQCRAARHSTIANLLDQEAELADSEHGGSGTAGQVFRLEALDRRNSAAADALEVFFRLVEAEAATANLARRANLLEQMQASAATLQRQGMGSPVSKADLEAQQVDLAHKQTELTATVRKLNVQLQEQLGIELAVDSGFWPQTSLVVGVQRPDPNEAIGLALANRADLAALRWAASAEGPDAVAAARAIAQAKSGGLLGSGARDGIRLLARRYEGDTRQEQLGQLLGDRQHAVRVEARQAALLVETRLTQVGLARHRVAIAEEQVRAAGQRGAQINPFSVRKARLDALAAEQDLLHDVIEWKIAVMRLKAVEGLLAAECGFGLGGQGCGP